MNNRIRFILPRGQSPRMILFGLLFALALVCVGVIVLAPPHAYSHPAPEPLQNEISPAARLAAITVDGSSADWSSSWQVMTDTASDIRHAVTNLTPHDSPYFARSGYDLTGLWMHHEDGVWYFRIDVDGLPGDSDSRTGTSTNLGVGTTGRDAGGPLGTADSGGVSAREEYTLMFATQDHADPEEYDQRAMVTAHTTPNQSFLLSVDPGDNTGTEGAFSNSSNPGITEFAIPNALLYPEGQCMDRLRIKAHVGSSEDRMAEDETNPTWVRYLQVGLNMSATPQSPQASEPLTYTINYTITGSDLTLINALPASNAYITSLVPANTTYVSHSGGVSQSGPANGVVTWTLDSPITPSASSSVTGTVTLIVSVNSAGAITDHAYLRINEGLCAQDAQSNGPTAVSVIAFNPAGLEGRTILHWQTERELWLNGFNVWRSTRADQHGVKLNTDMIVAQAPGSALGSEYSFVDSTTASGITYYYWLEEIELGGNSNWYGPVTVTPKPLLSKIYLPILLRP